MGAAASLDDVLEMVVGLSTLDKVRLVERVAPLIEAELDGGDRSPRRSEWGLCRDLGQAPSAEDIDEARRIAFSDFARGDV